MVLSSDIIAVLVGVVVPSVVFLAVLCYVCIMRMRSAASMPNYSQVAHELDSEELEFKRSIEMMADEDDDMEDLFFRAHGTPTRGEPGAASGANGSRGDSDAAALGDYSGLDAGMNDESHGSINPDDYSFDEEELSHLSILEKFRNNLMMDVGSNAASPLHESTAAADYGRSVHGKCVDSVLSEGPEEEDEGEGGGMEGTDGEEEDGGSGGRRAGSRPGGHKEAPDEIRP